MISEQLGKDYELVTIKGQEYHLAPITLAVFGKIEQRLKDELRRQRSADIAELKALDLPDDIYKGQVREILGRRVTDQDVQDYIETPAGAKMIIDLCLRKHHANLPDDFADQIPLAEIEQIFSVIAPKSMTSDTGEAVDSKNAQA